MISTSSTSTRSPFWETAIETSTVGTSSSASERAQGRRGDHAPAGPQRRARHRRSTTRVTTSTLPRPRAPCSCDRRCSSACSVGSPTCRRAFGFSLTNESEPTVCGIAGFWRADGLRDQDPSALRRMMALLRHRGPDGSGKHLDARRGLAMGHTRLSIIDLSARGKQPITDGAQSLVLTINGELYDYKTARAELACRGRALRHQDRQRDRAEALSPARARLRSVTCAASSPLRCLTISATVWCSYVTALVYGRSSII